MIGNKQENNKVIIQYYSSNIAEYSYSMDIYADGSICSESGDLMSEEYLGHGFSIKKEHLDSLVSRLMNAMDGLDKEYTIPESEIWFARTGFELNYRGMKKEVCYENQPPNPELGKISTELLDLLFASRLEEEKGRNKIQK